MRKKVPVSAIDIVIPHTDSSDWGHHELRYTLRSIEQNLTEYRNVIIVGHKPSFVDNVIHIKTPEYGRTKSHKILHKIILAINDQRVSDKFLYMSDDHYLLRKFSAPKFPYYYDMSLQDRCQMPISSSVYYDMISHTRDIYPDGKHFNIHCPMVYDKKLFKEAIENADWTKSGYIIKSLYGNYAKVKALQMSDCKIRQADDYKKVIESRPFFSIGINLNYAKMGRLMEDLYPTPSCFEADKKVYLAKS